MGYSSGMNMTEALLHAIQKDGRSLNAIATAAGADSGQLSRFTRGQRSLTLGTADALIQALGAECRLVRPRKAR